MNYLAAEPRGICKGIVTPQAAGNETLVRLRRIQSPEPAADDTGPISLLPVSV
jgi:hypothetical protein